MAKIPKENFKRDGMIVTLTKDFSLGIYEVTQAQWQTVMGNNPSHFKGDNRPVENVSWDDAKAFCDKLNKHYTEKLPPGYKFDLPTEALRQYGQVELPICKRA